MSICDSKHLNLSEIRKSREMAYTAVGVMLICCSAVLCLSGLIKEGICLFLIGLSFFVGFGSMLVLISMLFILFVYFVVWYENAHTSESSVKQNRTISQQKLPSFNCSNKNENTELSFIDIRNSIKCSTR